MLKKSVLHSATSGRTSSDARLQVYSVRRLSSLLAHSVRTSALFAPHTLSSGVRRRGERERRRGYAAIAFLGALWRTRTRALQREEATSDAQKGRKLETATQQQPQQQNQWSPFGMTHTLPVPKATTLHQPKREAT